jgi:hypothetical protein
MADSQFSDYEFEGRASKKPKIKTKKHKQKFRAEWTKDPACCAKKRERRTIMQSLMQKISCFRTALQ